MPIMSTVIFDLDGTLVDTAKDLMIAGNSTFEQLNWKIRLREGVDEGIAIQGGRAMINYGLSSESLSADIEFMASTYQMLLSHYDLTIDANSYVYDGIAQCLNRLELAGWNIGLCTNKPQNQANELLLRMKIRHFFKSFIGADTVGVAKPNPKPLLTSIAEAGGKPDDSVLVGDTKTDRDTALAAGVKSILVRYGHGALIHDLDELQPDCLVSTPDELFDSLERLFFD